LLALDDNSMSCDYKLKLSCDSRFQHAFTACVCVFKVITLVGSNQRNYLENATTCSKRTLKTTVATQLKCILVLTSRYLCSHKYSRIKANDRTLFRGRSNKSFEWDLHQSNRSNWWRHSLRNESCRCSYFPLRCHSGKPNISRLELELICFE